MVGWCVVAVSIIYSRFQLTGTRSFLSVISQSSIRHTLRTTFQLSGPVSSLRNCEDCRRNVGTIVRLRERNKTPSDHL